MPSRGRVHGRANFIAGTAHVDGLVGVCGPRGEPCGADRARGEPCGADRARRGRVGDGGETAERGRSVENDGGTSLGAAHGTSLEPAETVRIVEAVRGGRGLRSHRTRAP